MVLALFFVHMSCAALVYVKIISKFAKNMYDVTEFWKTNTLGLFHFIGPANSYYTRTLLIHSVIRLGYLVFFSGESFANHLIYDWDNRIHGVWV